jgi:hypothetical protein
MIPSPGRESDRGFFFEGESSITNRHGLEAGVLRRNVRIKGTKFALG